MSASSHQTGLHGAQVDAEDIGNFFVAQALDISQDDNGAKGFWDVSEFLFHACSNLLMGSELEGRLVLIEQGVFDRDGVTIILVADLRLDSYFLTLMPAPPAFLIGGLMDGNAIDPGLQAGVAVEVADAAKDFEEDFLGEVGGVGGVNDAARK